MTPTKQTNGGDIFKKIPAIMAEIPVIGKDRKNQGQGYNFRGIDDVYNMIQPIMAKHGVFMSAEILESRHEERQSGQGKAIMSRVTTIRYSFIAQDGSSVSTDAIGEGMDSGDKASAKAMSIAQKYAILQMFLVPTADAKDPENDDHDVKPKPKPAPRPPAKPTGDPLDEHYSAEDDADKGAAFRTIELTLSTGKKKLVTKFEAYKMFGKLKEAIGDAAYYDVLKLAGHKHANTIPDGTLPMVFAMLLDRHRTITEGAA